jgi:hypothetical protein
MQNSHLAISIYQLKVFELAALLIANFAMLTLK